jgi:autotransporter translocation and assembly factor TamB
MRWLRDLVLLILALALALWLAWWWLSPRLVERGRLWAEQTLSAELRLPVAIGHVEVHLFPPKLHVKGMRVGVDGSAARAESVQLRWFPYTSLLQLRPVAEVDIEGLWLDVPQIEKASREEQIRRESRESTSTRPFPFRLRRVRLAKAAARLPYRRGWMEVQVAKLDGHAEVSTATSRLSAGLDAFDFVVKRGQESLRLDRVYAQGGQTWRGLSVSALEIRGPGVAVEGVVREAIELQHEVASTIDLQLLRVFGPPWEGLAGELRIDGALSGSLDDPDARATIGVRGLTVNATRIGKGDVGIEWMDHRLRVTSATLEGLGGVVAVDGTLDPRGDMRYAATASWRHLNVSELAALAGAEIDPSLNTSGEANVDGAIKAFSIAGEARGELAAGRNARTASWRLGGRYERGTADLKITAEQEAANRLRANVNLAPDESLSGGFDLEITDWNVLRALAQPFETPQLSGSLAASGSLSGHLREPVLTASLNGRSIEVLDVVVEEISGELTVDATQLETPRLRLVGGGGQIEAEGRFAFTSQAENDGRVAVSGVNTDFFAALADEIVSKEVPVSGGSVEAQVSVRGSWSKPQLQGTVRIRDATVWTEPMREIEARATVAWPRWEGHLVLTHTPQEDLHAEVRGWSWEDLNLSLRADQWSLKGLKLLPRRSRGKVSLAADIRGAPSALGGTISLKGENLVVARRQIGSPELTAQGEQGTWNVDATLAQGLSLHARASASGDFPFSAEVRIDGADVAPLMLSEPEFEFIASGSATLSARIVEISRLSGDLRLDSLVVRQEPYELQTAQPIAIRAEGGTFVLESVELAGNGSRFEISGEVNLDGEAHLSVQGRADLRLLELVGEPIESARGDVRLQVDVKRSAHTGTRVDGDASVEDATVDVGLPLVVSETGGRLIFSGEQIFIEQLNGRAGGGTFTLTGQVNLNQGLNLSWSVQEMNTGFLPWLEHEISGSGSVRGTWEDLTVAGDISVLQALYDEPIRLTEYLPWFRRTVARPKDRKPPKTKVRLDLHVVAPDDVFVENNFANMELRADLRVKGVVPNIRLDGPIEVLTGTVKFGKYEYEISRAIVEFRPELGLEPYLNIAAETEVATFDASYVITVQITGTTRDYEVALSSDDPSLSQTDIVSLITFGRTTAQFQEAGGGISVTSLVALAPGFYADTVEKGVEEILPLDQIEIEPTFSRTTGAFEPRVTIGKKFTEDLSALVATTFGVEPRRTLQLEYRLTPRVSAIGSWESETETQAGAFGAGLKFRYEYRRAPRYSLLLPWRGWQGGELR